MSQHDQPEQDPTPFNEIGGWSTPPARPSTPDIDLRALLSHVDLPLDVRGRDFQVCTASGGQWADAFGSITDATLIAATISALPALLDELDTLRAQVAAADGLADEWNEQGIAFFTGTRPGDLLRAALDTATPNPTPDTPCTACADYYPRLRHCTACGR